MTGVPIGEVIARADMVVSDPGHAQSTLWQYRWAWSQVDAFCTREGVLELSEDFVATFLRFVAVEHRDDRIKE